MNSKEQLSSQNKEQKGFDINVINTENFSICVFKDCDQEIIDGLTKESEKFISYESENFGGYRDKFVIDINVGGAKRKFIVKSKFILGLTADMSATVWREWKDYADNYEVFLRERNFESEQEAGPMTKQNLQEMARDARLADSVINEMLISRKASIKYFEAYGEELPVEKCVGSVVDRQGHKWVVFEYIDDLIDESNLSQDYLKDIKEAFANKMRQRLLDIGIFPGDLEAKNIAIRGESTHPELWKLVIIDLEEWQIK